MGKVDKAKLHKKNYFLFEHIQQKRKKKKKLTVANNEYYFILKMAFKLF